MATSWDDLGIDWTAPSSGIEMYSGLFHVFSALNERYRLGKQTSTDYYDLNNLKGVKISTLASTFSLGIFFLYNHYIPDDRDTYDTADLGGDNHLNYDQFAIPNTFEEADFTRLVGTSRADLFNPYITATSGSLPDKNFLRDCYKALEPFTILYAKANKAVQYTKSVNSPFASGAAAANTAYSSASTVITNTSGTLISPGFAYFQADTGFGTRSDYYTSYIDTKSSGINGDWTRGLISSSSAGEYEFDLLDKDDNQLGTPPVIYKPYLYFRNGSHSVYQVGTFKNRVYAGSTSNKYCTATSTTDPRTTETFTQITPTISGGNYKFKVFLDEAQSDGLPTTSAFAYNSCPVFGLLDLTSGTIANARIARYDNLVSPGIAVVETMTGSLGLDINDEQYLSYNTATP